MSRKYETAHSAKEPLNFVIRIVRNEPERIWNERELHDTYLSKGGTDSNVSHFTNRLRHFLNDEVHFFALLGLSTIVMFKSKALETLNEVVTPETNSDYEIAVIAEKIKSELHQIPSLSDVYPVLNIENIQTTTSHTLNTLLMMISTNFANRLKTMSLISGMINSVISDKTSLLQVGLGNLINEKRLKTNNW